MTVFDKYVMTDVVFKDWETNEPIEMFSFTAVDLGVKSTGANKNMIWAYNPEKNEIFNSYVSNTALQRRIRPLKTKNHKHAALTKLFYLLMDTNMTNTYGFGLGEHGSVTYLLNFYTKGNPYQ